MIWTCPLCKKRRFFADNNISWATCGGSDPVCIKCARTRLKEIQIHNNIYYSPEGHKKDKTCSHKWLHPHPGRYYCPKCTAEFNWICDCGGSGVVCPDHYAEFINDHKDIIKFLAEASW